MSVSDHQDEGSGDPGKGPPQAAIPAMQRMLDNPFLLLFLGVTIPTVLYIIWGVMEVASVPIGN